MIIGIVKVFNLRTWCSQSSKELPEGWQGDSGHRAGAGGYTKPVELRENRRNDFHRMNNPITYRVE